MQALRQLRRIKGLSQKDLAKAAGVGQDTISGIESGRHEPRPSTIRKLAKALNVEPQELTAPPGVPVVGGGALVGVAAGGASAQAAQPTVTVSVSLDLRWNVAEALKSGKELDPDELRELEEAARAQLTAE